MATAAASAAAAAAAAAEDEILTDEQTALKINNMINKNKVEDLKRFINKRQNLNVSNQWFGYLFYLLQTASVFSTSLGQSYTNPYLIWTGIGLTSFGTLIHAIINSNTKINNNLMKNIKEIKGGSYIDELNIDGLDEKKSIHSNPIGDALITNIVLDKVPENSSIV